jgi:hypothetical protein
MKRFDHRSILALAALLTALTVIFVVVLVALLGVEIGKTPRKPPQAPGKKDVPMGLEPLAFNESGQACVHGQLREGKPVGYYFLLKTACEITVQKQAPHVKIVLYRYMEKGKLMILDGGELRRKYLKPGEYVFSVERNSAAWTRNDNAPVYGFDVQQRQEGE